MVLCVCIYINDSLITNALHLASEFIVRKYYLSAALQGLVNVIHVVCPTLRWVLNAEAVCCGKSAVLQFSPVFP